MPGRFDYEKLAKYPHLRPEDVLIWERFIDKYPEQYLEVDYDVKVGTGRNYSSYPRDLITKDLEYLSKKRIDVVGYTSDEIHIIEVKPSAGPSALGQVISYRDLFEIEVATELLIVPMIITNEEMPDTRDLCLKHSILYFVV